MGSLTLDSKSDTGIGGLRGGQGERTNKARLGQDQPCGLEQEQERSKRSQRRKRKEEKEAAGEPRDPALVSHHD